MPSVKILQRDETLGRIVEKLLVVSSGFPYYIPETELVAIEDNNYQPLTLNLKIDGSLELGGFVMEGN